MAEHAIEINEVSKVYPGGQKALDGFSLNVKKGEVFGFLGPNGAGKTTTIKMLLGFMPPTSGTLTVLGGDPQDVQVRKKIGYLPEVANYYSFMTVVELLKFYGDLCGMTKELINERSDLLIKKVGLDEHRKKQLKNFSKGMLQRAGLAQALLHDPELLILDEPMTGLDPLARMQIREIIVEMRNQGKTVFFSSHELSEAETVCDRFAIIKSGTTRWSGSSNEVVGDGSKNLERIFLDIISNK